MIVTLQIDTSEALSSEDKAILRALGYMDEAAETAAPAAKKTAAKKTAAKKTFPTDAERAEAPPASEAVVEGTVVEESDEDLLDAALARASELLSSGHRDRVTTALKATGAPKVREIPADKMAGFLKALEG